MITKLLSKFLLKMPSLDYSFIDDNNNNTNTNTNNTQKRKNKTIKRKPISSYSDQENESRPPEIKKLTRDFINKVEKDVPIPMNPGYLDEDELADFEPIEPPILNQKSDDDAGTGAGAGTGETQAYEPTYKDTYNRTADAPLDDSVEMNDLNQLNNGHQSRGNYIAQYKLNDKNNVPYLLQHQDKNNNTGYAPSQMDSRLIEKINYMVKLLEDNHDEKTGHVTEELILYGFLGIFIIFIVDSFVRVGKYTR